MIEKNNPAYKGLKIETIVKLNKFRPRKYQIPIINAIEKEGYKKLIIVMARRAGKDIVAFNIMIRQALKRIGIYYYILPTATQARKVMFQGMTIDGKRILDFIPDELIEKINIQEMRIVLKNGGSSIQFVGSDNFDSLRGSNPAGIVFSEAAFQHNQVYPTLRPVLAANDGWCIHISTPFGENHFYNLWEVAKNNPKEWFTYFAGVDVTQHISQEQIQAEIDSGEISPHLAQQEYYCSFSTGATGAFYATYLNRMELNGQVTDVEWEPNFPVHTAWDLGVRDSTVILMFQIIGRSIRIIDMYENANVGLEHYINVLQAKEYTWGKHIAPHDIAVREFAGGALTRQEKAAQLGFRFTIAPKLSIIDGIESVRTLLPRVHVDQRNCRRLIAALRNYRKEYDTARKIYKGTPLHDSNSNVCDALRYLAVTLPRINTQADPEALERRYQETVYGRQSNMPKFFQDTNDYY